MHFSYTHPKSEQERLAQTVSIWYYSFCEENCTERNCPCIQLPYLKSQQQSKRHGSRELRQVRYGHLLANHILLLCAAGKSPTEIADFLFCSRSSVYRSVKAYRAARLDWQRDDPSSPCLSRWQKMLRSLIKLSPRVLGWCRVR